MSCFRYIDYNYVFSPGITATPSSENSNFPVSNLRNFTRAIAYRSTDTEMNIVWDLQTIEEIDSFVIVFDPLIGNKLTAGATVKLQGSATDSWASPAVSVTLTLDTDWDSYTHFFSEAQEYRYWRLYINDPGNPYGYVELHSVFLGKSLIFDRENPQIGFTYSFDARTQVNRNEYGHYYANVYPDLKVFEFDWNFMKQDDIKKLHNSYREFGNAAPVIVVMDSSGDLLDTDHFLVYGILTGDLKSNHLIRDIFNTKIKVEEVF